ncbi:SDR family oxidoreductase [Pseudoroseomonas wenyumeiae]
MPLQHLQDRAGPADQGLRHRAGRIRHPRQCAGAGFAAGSDVSQLTQAHVDNVIANIPAGRPTSPQDVGNAALFLASSASAYITGASLPVDGGNSIGSLAVYQDKKHAL